MNYLYLIIFALYSCFSITPSQAYEIGDEDSPTNMTSSSSSSSSCELFAENNGGKNNSSEVEEKNQRGILHKINEDSKEALEIVNQTISRAWRWVKNLFTISIFNEEDFQMDNIPPAGF